MRSIEEVRKICGHYYYNENMEKSKLFSPHKCHHKKRLRCDNNFKYCPLYEFVKRPQKQSS